MLLAHHHIVCLCSFARGICTKIVAPYGVSHGAPLLMNTSLHEPCLEQLTGWHFQDYFAIAKLTMANATLKTLHTISFNIVPTDQNIEIYLQSMFYNSIATIAPISICGNLSGLDGPQVPT